MRQHLRLVSLKVRGSSVTLSVNSNLELGRSRLAVRTDRPCVQIELAKCEEIDGIMAVGVTRGTRSRVIDALTPDKNMVHGSADKRLTYTGSRLDSKI